MPNHQDTAIRLLAATAVMLAPWPLSFVLGILLRRWLRPPGISRRLAVVVVWLLLILASG